VTEQDEEKEADTLIPMYPSTSRHAAKHASGRVCAHPEDTRALSRALSHTHSVSAPLSSARARARALSLSRPMRPLTSLPISHATKQERSVCVHTGTASPAFCHSLQAVNKTSSSSSPTSPLSRQAESTNLTTNTPEAESCPRGASAGGGSVSRSTSWQRHSVQQRPSSSPRPTPASSTRAARSCTGDSTHAPTRRCQGGARGQW